MNNLNMRRVLKQPTLRMSTGGGLPRPEEGQAIGAGNSIPTEGLRTYTEADGVAAAAAHKVNMDGFARQSAYFAPPAADPVAAPTTSLAQSNAAKSFVGAGIGGQQLGVPGITQSGPIMAQDGLELHAQEGFLSSVRGLLRPAPAASAPVDRIAANKARLQAEGGTWGNVGGATTPQAPATPSALRGDGVSSQTKAALRAIEVADNPMLKKHGGDDLQTGQGGNVPGHGRGDKVPAKYEPGEFVVSNDMLDAEPKLREHLRSLRESVLAEKGMTPQMADAQALGQHPGQLRANNAFGAPIWPNAASIPDLSLENVGKQPMPAAAQAAENTYQLKKVAALNAPGNVTRGMQPPLPAGELPPHVNPFAAGADEAQALKDSVRATASRAAGTSAAGGTGNGFVYGNKIPPAPAPTPNMPAAHGNGTYGAPANAITQTPAELRAAQLAAQTPEEIAHGARMAAEGEAAAKANAPKAAPKATGMKGVVEGAKSAAGSVANGAKYVAKGEFLKADVGKVLRGGANLGKSVLKSPFTPVGLAAGAAEATHEGLNTPTEQYRLRAGMDSHGGVMGDLAARSAGVLADFGDAITFGGATRLGNAIAGRGFVPNAPGSATPVAADAGAQSGAPKARYSPAADSQAAADYPYVAAPVQPETPKTVRGADGRMYIAEAVTQGDHNRSDAVINSAFANRPKTGVENGERLNMLRDNAGSMDMFNKGLAMRGAGVQMTKDANGSLRLEGSTAPTKMQYTDMNGAPTTDYRKTNQYAEGMQAREKLLADAAALDRRNAEREAAEADARERAAIPGVGMFGHNNATRAYENRVQLRQTAARDAAAAQHNQAQIGVQQEHNKVLREGQENQLRIATAPMEYAKYQRGVLAQLINEQGKGGKGGAPDYVAIRNKMLQSGLPVEEIDKVIASDNSIKQAAQTLGDAQTKSMDDAFANHFDYVDAKGETVRDKKVEAIAAKQFRTLTGGKNLTPTELQAHRNDAIDYAKTVQAMRAKAQLRNSSWQTGMPWGEVKPLPEAIPASGERGKVGWWDGTFTGHGLSKGDHTFGGEEMDAGVDQGVLNYLDRVAAARKNLRN